MSILIKGMTAKELLDVFQWARTGANNCMIGHGVVATELPDHGDLIERDPIRASFKESIESCAAWRKEIAEDREDYAEMMARIDNTIATFVECSLRLKNAPVVIPAERSEE